MIKYVLISCFAGEHYIPAIKLLELYGLRSINQRDVLLVNNEENLKGVKLLNLIVLYPRPAGDYKEHLQNLINKKHGLSEELLEHYLKKGWNKEYIEELYYLFYNNNIKKLIFMESVELSFAVNKFGKIMYNYFEIFLLKIDTFFKKIKGE